MSTVFLGPALITLAKAAAKSNCNDDESEFDHYDGGCTNDDDEGRVYGMRPTSLLTNIGVFSGLISTVLLPLFGAIVDHTPHRKAVGRGSAIVLSIVKGIEICVSQSTWFFVSFLQVINFVMYNVHLCAVYAYTAEVRSVRKRKGSNLREGCSSRKRFWRTTSL